MKKIALIIGAFLLTTQSGFSQEIPRWKMSDLQAYIKKSDVPVVVNFWATFCKPCVEEIPWFLEVVNKYKGQKVKLLLVSLDIPAFYPARVQSFAKKNNFEAEMVWLDEANADEFCPQIDPDWSGAIPATLIINNKTGYRKFFEQQLRAQFFEARLKDAIGNK